MMDAFAAKLKTPTYVLYSIFILIPLALVALIPAVSIVGVRTDTLTLCMDLWHRMALFTFFIRNTFLLQRPCHIFTHRTYQIEHPDLQNIHSTRKNIIILALITGSVIGFSGYILRYFGILSYYLKRSYDRLVLPTFPAVLGYGCHDHRYYCLGVYTPYKKYGTE